MANDRTTCFFSRISFFCARHCQDLNLLGRHSEALDWFEKAMSVSERIDRRNDSVEAATSFFGAGEALQALGQVRTSA
jgi:hypothetical protein